jgi:hypothetical protein
LLLWYIAFSGIAHHSSLTRIQRMTRSYQIKIEFNRIRQMRNKAVQVQSFTGPWVAEIFVTQSTQHFPLSDIPMTALFCSSPSKCSIKKFCEVLRCLSKMGEALSVRAPVLASVTESIEFLHSQNVPNKISNVRGGIISKEKVRPGRRPSARFLTRTVTTAGSRLQFRIDSDVQRTGSRQLLWPSSKLA